MKKIIYYGKKINISNAVKGDLELIRKELASSSNRGIGRITSVLYDYEEAFGKLLELENRAQG